MDADAVLGLLDALDRRDVHHWLDGGWGVDCLLEEQTRAHDDLDLVVHRRQLGEVGALLRDRGFVVVRDLLPTAVAWRDPAGREVDLHPVDPTPDGGGDQRLQDGSAWHYGPPALGRVAGRVVRCAPAVEQVAMHQGYEARPVDVRDVRRLAARFGLPLPEAFDPRTG